ncbi:enoyl-CoA hydratase-related protein [Breoghania sp.]|uniref:enoyl-CoA hydratase-related protein n=1 Tax=Breoghania sp. TaxID=2065378 RepID=UPI002604A335|nr:enoyl-CoA hydratase-related protein [Breoghania sp.]MDJ0930683.1 enoyl-CoA hydratase-related protein [Breoghania sp.]
MTDYQEIRVENADRIATITLNRPDRLNAWTPRMADEVRHAVGIAGQDPDIRCIAITGTGRGFCAGAEVKNLEITVERGKSRGEETLHPDDIAFEDAPGPDLAGIYPDHFGYLYDCPKPVIATINGPCVWIDLVFTLYCDFRYAAEDAVFTTAFAARGLIAEHGSAWVLPRLIGEQAALDLLLSARKFRGTEAAALELVNAALPGTSLMETVRETAAHLAVISSPRSMAVMKRQIQATRSQDFAKALAVADTEMHASFATPDFREGVESLVEQRTPAFPDL